MAKIPQEMHAVIRRQVDEEGRKVAEVAAEYGCTPANIYAILTKARRQDSDPGTAALPIAAVTPQAPVTAAKARKVKAAPAERAPVDLFAGFGEEEPPAATAPAGAPAKKAGPAKPGKTSDRPAPALEAAKAKLSRVQSAPPALEKSDRKGPPPKDTAASAARVKGKMGYALIMRTVDGEETVNPFRSLDELLSTSKVLLRTAVRSAEPIWFSIQQVDLDALADDSF
jgi:transposase-like protein